MFSSPQAEHEWLGKLVGNWNVESSCQMEPDQPWQTQEGTLAVRALGGLWVLAEGEGNAPDGGEWRSVLTLGFDPVQGRYLGTFVASMMTHLWLYSGVRDADSSRLVLDTEGPRMDQPGLGKYQDIVEWINDEEWTLSSQLLMEDGSWVPFMKAVHHRA